MLNISDFSLFCKNCNPPEKSYPLLFQQPPLKGEVLSSPPLLKIWYKVQPPPPPSRKRGCTLCYCLYIKKKIRCVLLPICILSHLTYKMKIEINGQIASPLKLKTHSLTLYTV